MVDKPRLHEKRVLYIAFNFTLVWFLLFTIIKETLKIFISFMTVQRGNMTVISKYIHVHPQSVHSQQVSECWSAGG